MIYPYRPAGLRETRAPNPIPSRAHTFPITLPRRSGFVPDAQFTVHAEPAPSPTRRNRHGPLGLPENRLSPPPPTRTRSYRCVFVLIRYPGGGGGGEGGLGRVGALVSRSLAIDP